METFETEYSVAIQFPYFSFPAYFSFHIAIQKVRVINELHLFLLRAIM